MFKYLTVWFAKYHPGQVSESMKEEFEVEYPLAEATAAVGFFFVLMLEQLVTSYCIGKKKQNENGRTSASKATQAVAAANEPGAEVKHVQVDILGREDLIFATCKLKI